jgi:group I intron endonuclease
MKSGIYVWKLDGIPKYVGYGLDVENRMLDRHRKNPHICEYDYNEFEKIIIRICKPDELRKLETYYIKKLHTHISEGGFNYNWGGGGCGKQTSKSKKKISDALSGENSPNFGKRLPKETRQKMSESRIRLFSGENHPRFGKKLKNASSKYHGVYLLKQDKYNYWQVRICIGKKKSYISECKNEIDAARIYDQYVIEHNLNRPLNFPEDYL